MYQGSLLARTPRGGGETHWPQEWRQYYFSKTGTYLLISKNLYHEAWKTLPELEFAKVKSCLWKPIPGG